MKVMFDTNVFNHLLDGHIDKNSIPADWEVYATHIQRNEIKETKQPRQSELMALFTKYIEVRIPTESLAVGASAVGEAKITENLIPTESGVWDKVEWGQFKWSSETDNLYYVIRDALNERKPKRKDSNIRDALIAETAIKNDFILVTNDSDLKEVIEEVLNLKGKVIDLRTS